MEGRRTMSWSHAVAGFQDTAKAGHCEQEGLYELVRVLLGIKRQPGRFSEACSLFEGRLSRLRVWHRTGRPVYGVPHMARGIEVSRIHARPPGKDGKAQLAFMLTSPPRVRR